MLTTFKNGYFTGSKTTPSSLKANLKGYFVVNRSGQFCYSSKAAPLISNNPDELMRQVSALRFHLDHPEAPGAFYKNQPCRPGGQNDYTVFIGPGPDSDEVLVVFFESGLCMDGDRIINSEMFILSLITQAIRAINQANELADILRIILIGVTAGSGLGFNRAFIFLTGQCDNTLCLIGTHAIGPSSPEEAGAIWQKLSSGELTLDSMFDDVLQHKGQEYQSIDGLLSGLRIPLDKKDNLFARAALEMKSMIIDESILNVPAYAEFRNRLGTGPLAVVPLVGKESLQGVLVADNFITHKPITESDLQLLEIFARYASDSIEKFRLYESLEKKIDELKRANEMIILSRENLIKAERLSVLAEMAGHVAHEVRNPLTVIGGFAKSMLRKMPIDHDNHEYLNIIVEQVIRIEQALGKFTSLLNYQTKNDCICDLRELVKSTLDLKATELVQCHFEIEDSEPIKIKADPDLLRQALMLIMNKACAIIENCQKMTLSLARIGNKGVIYFEPASDKQIYAETLFRNFHLGGNHELRRELAIALEILKYYGGNIGLETNGIGEMKFYVELPTFEEGR
jgi:signal transduction histidine kinase